jgi:hypothetical protein
MNRPVFNLAFRPVAGEPPVAIRLRKFSSWDVEAFG